MVDKRKTSTSRHWDEMDRFHRFLVSLLVGGEGSSLADAKVIIDGSGDREFRRDLGTYLRRKSPKGAIREVRFKDSRSDPLLQLADMCVGAIARSHRTDRPDADRWLRLLTPRIVQLVDYQ